MLEKVLLVLAGLKEDEAIKAYQRKIDAVFVRCQSKCIKESPARYVQLPLYRHRSFARCMFDYLWTSKPKRFGASFFLTEAIDAQLDPDVNRPVGTCVGLTSLFSVLGLRAGLQLSLLMDSEHVLNRLRIGEQIIDIDNTDPQGFNCRTSGDFTEFPLPLLAANVLNSRGLYKERNGSFMAAREDYEKAVRVNPGYANAYNNRGNMKFLGNDVEAAIADYGAAIGLNPNFCEAYCNRGMAWQRLGRYEEARLDYHMAMAINGDYADAQRCLRLLDEPESR